MKNNKPGKERQILHECLENDRKDLIVREYWNLVYLVVRETLFFHRVACISWDIHELRNDVFFQLFKDNCRKLRQYDHTKGMSLSGWIRLVANQTTLNEIRKNGWLDLAKQNFRVPIEEIEEMLVYDEEKRLDAREKLKMIQNAMEKLSPRDRDVLKKHYFEWKSLQEIADSVGERYGTAAKIIHDAKKRLMESFKSN
ncbi:MAG: sigma-70 family RNA polymerase sigma factor [Desulfobacterales bacterium]|nr:sigma-70 family RNA polymerase sigma factor [Desulfobacterales bacterium]